MKHIFILNPVAGKTHMALELRGRIDAYFARHPEQEHVIHLTDGKGAATRIAQMECQKGDPIRLYACGGDGTLQETANGIPLNCDWVELAVIPCGSGNDYVRTYGGSEPFLDLDDLIDGTTIPVDAVRCGELLSLNIAAIGMDAAVADKMARYKHLPGVSGSMAYNLAIADVFCHSIGENMEIEIDGVDGPIRRSGSYLMTLAANGQYYGGGYRGAPKAVEDDGVLDFVLVKKIPRLQIPFILGKYKAGEHEELSCLEHLRGYAMRVTADKPAVCTVDGECFTRDKIDFTIIPGAFNFVLPASVYARRVKGSKLKSKVKL